MKSSTKKYTVKPPKDLTSKYDAYMHQRHLDKIQSEKDRLQDEENKRIAVSLVFSMIRTESISKTFSLRVMFYYFLI